MCDLHELLDNRNNDRLCRHTPARPCSAPPSRASERYWIVKDSDANYPNRWKVSILHACSHVRERECVCAVCCVCVSSTHLPLHMLAC